MIRSLFALFLVAQVAWGAEPAYPTKPVRLVVPAAAAGGTDYVARLIAQKLSEVFGQPVIVDNRAAIDGIMGTATVAEARPDGYTLMLVSSSHAINAALGRKLPYDTLRDFEMIVHTANQQLFLMVHPSVPAKSIRELIALLQTKPDALNYGSSSNASALPMELFKAMTGTRIQHVPYKGAAPMLTDLVAGQTQLSIAPAISSIPHAKAGRLRALAIAGPKRSAAMPDLPTIAEAGVPGYEASIWTGMFAPAKTPQSVIRRVNTEVNQIVRTREFGERLVNSGAEPAGGTPEEWTIFLKNEIAKWAKIAQIAGMKAE